MDKKNIVNDTLGNKIELEKLIDMLNKLDYFIERTEDEDKLKEYTEYRLQLEVKIKELKGVFKLNIEDTKRFMSKIAYSIQRDVNEIAMNKQIKKEREKTIKSLENNIENKKQYLIEIGKMIGLFEDYDTVKLGAFSVRVNKQASLNIVDENIIKDDYKTEKLTIEIDKKKIKEALENGIKVEGAELKHNLIITGGKVKGGENENID